MQLMEAALFSSKFFFKVFFSNGVAQNRMGPEEWRKNKTLIFASDVTVHPLTLVLTHVIYGTLFLNICDNILADDPARCFKQSCCKETTRLSNGTGSIDTFVEPDLPRRMWVRFSRKILGVMLEKWQATHHRNLLLLPVCTQPRNESLLVKSVATPCITR